VVASISKPSIYHAGEVEPAVYAHVGHTPRCTEKLEGTEKKSWTDVAAKSAKIDSMGRKSQEHRHPQTSGGRTIFHHAVESIDT
jgi:hypothetical protein